MKILIMKIQKFLLLLLWLIGLVLAVPSSGHVALMVDSQSLTTGEQLFASYVQDAKVDASTAAMLRGRITAAAAAFADAEADMEMGADLGMDYALETNRSSGGPVADTGSDKGPATLAEYCAGPTKAEQDGDIDEGAEVKANWEGYGTMYPGKVKDVNSDGTVDIKYDDGFTEKNVRMKKVKVAKDKDSKSAKKAVKPRDDPACKLQKFLKKLQDQLKKLNKMVSQWLAAQRAKIAGDTKPAPRPKLKVVAAPAAAPKSGAPATADETEELEQLKEQLAEREELIKELEAQAEENNKELQKLLPKDEDQQPVSAIDQLIAQYMARIANRDARIEQLQQLIAEQEAELARMAAGQLSLADIDAAVTELEKDLEEARRKRDELEKDGELDPELRSVIDGIIKALQKMRKKVDNLIALEEKAKADREKAEREADKAAEDARRKAEAEGKDPDEAAAAAAEKAEKENAESVRKADLETMKAAQEVSKEMKEAEKGAAQLDTGLHPHGAKWWRYRYEHSYIEAVIMIFISFLMVVWSKLMQHLKHFVHLWALPQGALPKTHLEELEEETHGSVYLIWLHLLAEQMMVCILVFLTVWLMAKTALSDYVPHVIKSSKDMRVPDTGDEYRRLALDICTIFFFAIMFYFCLMFAVAHDTFDMTHTLESFEKEEQPNKKKMKAGISAAAMGTAAGNADEFAVVKRHFIRHMNHDMVHCDDPKYREISRLMNDDLNQFPVSKYLKFNVRLSVAELFQFGWTMWLPVIVCFVVFMLLHRFAHMGYVRIMGFFGLVTLAVIMGMGYYVKSMASEIQKEEDPKPGAKKQSIHIEYPTEKITLGVLQFTMFFVCYGVARMICQPWMWELHFWPVLCLSIVAIISAILFVLLVSPAIPSFCALVSVPPYVDSDNLQTMLFIADSISKGSGAGITPRPQEKASGR
jgi:hypothetical protein